MLMHGIPFCAIWVGLIFLERWVDDAQEKMGNYMHNYVNDYIYNYIYHYIYVCDYSASYYS